MTPINGITLEQVFREIRVAYGDSPNNELALEIAEILSKNGNFSGPEYRFMCWLKYKGLFSSDGIVLPNVLQRDEIPLMSIQEFQNKFTYNDYRRKLFDELVDAVAKLRLTKSIHSPLNVVIGGSYLDDGNDFPRDIDCIFLIPENIWTKNPIAFMEVVLRDMLSNSTLIDFKTLPDNFSLDHFKGYNDMSLMANNTKIRDNGNRMVTNEFLSRRVVSIMF